MRGSATGALIVSGAAIVGALFTIGVRPTISQGSDVAAGGRTATGKPNLNGVWQVMNTANWDIQDHDAQPSPFPHLLGAIGAVPAGRGVVEGNEIPYQAWAQAKKKENFAKRMAMDTEDLTIGDPEAKCYLPGVPRATYMPYPFQILQGDEHITIAYEFSHATRVIHLDNEPPPGVDSWMGHSIGRWEGDTLVVDVTEQNDRTWFDRAGNFHSDQLHVVERYTPRGIDGLMYEATIEDRNVFTRPWKMTMPLYRHVEPNAEIFEFRCVEFAEPFMYGSLVRPPLK